MGERRMRRLGLLIVMSLLCACSTTGAHQAFAPNQVWRLRNPEFAEARVVIGVVEPRGDRTVAHVSVIGLPAPQGAADFLSALAQQSDRAAGGQPLTDFFIADASSMADLSVSPENPDGSIAVPHIAVYQEDLRAALSRLERGAETPHSMFETYVDLWRRGETRWPELNDRELDQPFSERLAMAVHGAANVISDPTLLSHMGPPPPASAAPGEAAIDDPALDARCRRIVDPGPLAPETITQLLDHGFTRDEIPEIDVMLSNITITSSENWGHVWRADSVDEHDPPRQGEGRSVCWRKDGAEEPTVTFYPQPSAPADSVQGNR